MDDPTTLTPAWTSEQALQAQAEGWGLFDCGKHWELQRIDSPEDGSTPLQDDGAAWEIVRNSAQPHHLAVMAFLQAHEPAEWAIVTGYRRRATIRSIPT